MKLFAVVMACALAGACEKSGDHKTLAPDDMSLLKDLPGGNTVIVGGNFMKLQGFMDSTLGKLTENMMVSNGADGPGYKAWSECFMNTPKIRMAGGISIATTVEMRFVFSGMTIADVNGCATKASYKATVDPDGKYISVDVPGIAGQTMAAGYMALPDGALLFDQAMKLGPAPSVVPSSRATLEGLAGKLATDNATSDKHLIELARKADRTKTLWFAGTGANTPIADKVGDTYGTFEMKDGGMSGEATITFTDGSFAARVEEGVTDMKKNSAFMPPALKGIIESIQVQRTDATVHVSGAITAEQLTAMAALKGIK